MVAFNPLNFGISNGVITVLSLITGLLAVDAPRSIILVTLLSLLISDPLMDAYSISLGIKDEKESMDAGISAFVSQFSIQLAFILIILLVPSKRMAALSSLLFGVTIILWNIQETTYKIRVISMLILIIFVSVYSNHKIKPYLLKHFTS